MSKHVYSNLSAVAWSKAGAPRGLIATAVLFSLCQASEAGITTFADEDAWTANFACVNVAGFEPEDGLNYWDQVSDQYEGLLIESLVPDYAVPRADYHFAHGGLQSLVVATQWNGTTQPWQMTFAEPVQGFSLWTYDVQAGWFGDTYVRLFDGGDELIGEFGLEDTQPAHGHAVWAFNGFLSDSASIARIEIDPPPWPAHDALWFDDVAWASNQPPVITCNDPVVLWSPDHEFYEISDAFDVSDPDDDEVTLTYRVISDESEVPDTGDGTGKHAPDFKTVLASQETGVFLRSERRGPEDGRFYIFVITADDGNCGVTTAVCIAAICPHDQDPDSLLDVLGQAETAALAVEAVVDQLTVGAPGNPLPDEINHLYEHGVSEELGPKQ